MAQNADAPTMPDTDAEGYTAEQRSMIERRRRMTDAMYGPGAYDRAIAKVKPHRCARHLDDIFEGARQAQFDVSGPLGNFLRCLWSSPGNEPPRLYPDSVPFNLSTPRAQWSQSPSAAATSDSSLGDSDGGSNAL
ncbi:hypothetical protein BC831DRAFT_451583 [Entophlyctis helioformis]|nr:hypothetical protein BC831DRAFT_451583 [Entophlyctis helioformis]